MHETPHPDPGDPWHAVCTLSAAMRSWAIALAVVATSSGCYLWHGKPRDDVPAAPAEAGDGGARDARAPVDAGTAPAIRDAGVPLDAFVPGCDASAGTPPRPVSELTLDLLFLVDNSGSMGEEQVSLTEQFPRMVTLLATGDMNGDGTPDFPPVSDLHVGVITSDMGSGGYRVESCDDPLFGDDGLLRTRGRVVPECDDSYPRFLTFSADVDTSAVSDLAHDFGCVAIVGTNGCGLEQQLEAVLKAVTPSTSPIRFFRDTVGHGDLENSGFLRPDSILAVVVVTDEDDCSIADASLADETSPRYTSEFDMRCIEYEREALHPIARYVDGLRQLRTAHPDRLVFAAITGVPEDLVSDPEAIDYDAILADPRMTPTPHPVLEGRLRPSCEVLGRGFATPPRRIVRVAREFGDAAIVQSICQSSFDGALRAITERLGSIVRRVGCGEEEGGGSGT